MANFDEMCQKYPSLKKFAEQGDDYVEWKDGREARVLQYVKARPDFDQIVNHPAKVLAAMDEFAAQQDFLISIGTDKTRVLEEILTQEKPRVLVELGGYLGYSAIFFANEMRRLAPTGEAVCVWSLEFEPEFAQIATEFVAMAGLSDLVKIVTGPADESLRTLQRAGQIKSVDVLFLDHVEELYEQDFKVAEELGLFKPGTCIIADNVVRPGAPKYRDYARSRSDLQSRGVRGLIMPGEMEDELEITKVLVPITASN